MFKSLGLVWLIGAALSMLLFTSLTYLLKDANERSQDMTNDEVTGVFSVGLLWPLFVPLFISMLLLDFCS